MKILRVGMSYPRDTAPGMGQHIYNHSYFSEHEELLLVAKRDGILRKNREGVRIVEIDAGNAGLAYYDAGIFIKVKKAVGKFSDQYDFYKKAKKYIDEFKPDIVHVYSAIPIMCGIYARNKYKSKIVMTLHGGEVRRIKDNPILKKTLEIPDAVASVSRTMIDELSFVKTKRPIYYIANGVDHSKFSNQKKERKNQFINVGILGKKKGQQYLIEGFYLFSRSNPDYKLVIIGDGEERAALLELIREYGLKDKVYMAGMQDSVYINNALNESRAFVLTSVSEGFPKVIIEAMATGTPVISSDTGNVSEIIGNAGIVFPIRDSKAVADAMEKIVSGDCNWDRLSEKSEEIAKDYTWEKLARRLDRIYKEVTG